MITKKEMVQARVNYVNHIICIRGEKYVYNNKEYDTNILAVRARSFDINNEETDNE